MPNPSQSLSSGSSSSWELVSIIARSIPEFSELSTLLVPFCVSRSIQHTFQSTSANLVTVFVRTKDYDLLAGIFLAVTGSEAMFAKSVYEAISYMRLLTSFPISLGQFNAASIRIGFCAFVYPALVLAYLGQGARLIHDGADTLNGVFYKTIPGPTGGPLYWYVYNLTPSPRLYVQRVLQDCLRFCRPCYSTLTSRHEATD